MTQRSSYEQEPISSLSKHFNRKSKDEDGQTCISLHIYTKGYVSSVEERPWEPRTSERFHGSYSWILFTWVDLIVFRNNAETDYTHCGFHSNNEGCRTNSFFKLLQAN